MRSIVLAFCLLTTVWILGCTITKKNTAPYSEWSFLNRATGDYFYEDNGQIKTGKTAEGDQYRWIDEATGTAEVRIRNKKTGHYLQLTANGNVSVAASADTSDSHSRWTFKGFNFRRMSNCSWYSLSNGSTGDKKFLTQAGTGLSVEERNREMDSTLHWTLVREAGSKLPFTISADSVIDASFLGDRIAKALSASEIISNYHGNGHAWKLKQDISRFPVFSAEGNQMIPALYNMALEELQLNLRDDSTFRTGKLWPDTWTRDAVYSIYFAFSWIQPTISLNTLRKQTLKDPREALQDTGTGGSWPISTDRVVWAIAAWEYYLSTGDKQWLAEAYDGLRYTAQKDLQVAFDEKIGLFRGEACSMDWRTHTYPNWFSNENIGESFSSGTNALHFFNYGFLERAGRLLGKDSIETNEWKKVQQRVQQGLNTYCWSKEKGLYTAYLYPAFLGYRASDRVDIMSNGLCALLGVASMDQVQSIVGKYPLYPYGGATLYPTIPDDFAYHNKSIWAVWETPLMYTAKHTGNEAVASHLMKSLVRQGAMFLTHKENMTYDTGFDENTALNSDRQLWSVAAYISMVYRVLFGMELTEQGIHFNPMVPADLIKGKLRLKNFPYRDALLDISVDGNGNKIKSITVNGKLESPTYLLPAAAKGKFDIQIQLEGESAAEQPITLVQPGPGKCWSPLEPVLQTDKQQLSWNADTGLTYHIVGPGIDVLATPPYSLRGKPNGFYSVYATDARGFRSDCSNTIVHSSFEARVEAETSTKPSIQTPVATGFSGKGYVADLAEAAASLVFEIEVPENGDYTISIKGSNGRGPHDTYCYIRSVFADGKDIGTFILESSGNWNQWTRSNQLIMTNLVKGKHEIKLVLNPEARGYDNNMSFAKGKNYKNEAYVDCLDIIRL